MWGEKKTKIVATLSDFRANEEFVRGLFEAGMDVVRINSAHVTEEGAAKIVEAVRRVNPAIPVILDTKGPEIRVTAVADEYGGARDGQWRTFDPRYDLLQRGDGGTRYCGRCAVVDCRR